jgi:hypothetical protein
MPISRITPPLDYLQAASRASLQSFELTRLNHAANLRNEIAALIDQWIQETSEALLARWMLENRSATPPASSQSPDVMRTLLNSTAATLPEIPSSLNEVLPPQPRYVSQSDLKTPLSRKHQKPRQPATG